MATYLGNTTAIEVANSDTICAPLVIQTFARYSDKGTQ